MSSTRSEHADDEETREVATGNDADKPADEEGPRHRATGSKTTPAGEIGREPVGKAEDAQAGKAEDAGTKPAASSDDIWRTSASRSAEAGSAEQKDDGVGTVPRSGTDQSS
jgi:hypothetical protein